MTERPDLISVDLGPVAHGALDALVKRYKKNQSDVIRDLIITDYQFKVMGKLSGVATKLSNKHVPPAQPSRKTTDEERHIIQVYKEVYNVDKNVYFPPALSTIRAAHNNGLTYEQIEEIVRVSPNDSWLAQQMSRGNTPQLHVILSEKMIANLWDLAQESLRADRDRARLSLEGTVKPEAMRTLKQLLTPDQYSAAYDMIKECMTPDDVAQVVRAATEERWDEFVQRTQEAVEMFDKAMKEEFGAGD